MIDILNTRILTVSLLSSSEENQLKIHSALPGISKSLQCIYSFFVLKKADFSEQKHYFLPPIFQLMKYLSFINLTTFCLVFGLVICFISKFSEKFLSSLEKISLFLRSHPILVGKATFSCTTGLTVTEFTPVSEELLPAMSAPLWIHIYFYICV